MKMQFVRTTIVAIASTVIFSASAAVACCTESEAREALHSGNFDMAADMGPELGTPEGRLIGSEALSSKVLLGMAEDSKNAAKEARKMAAAVMEEHPDNLEAQFQHALADGFVTREASPMTAWRKKLPQKTKAIIDTLIEKNPNDGRAYALRGAWNMNILRETGKKNGMRWFGASLEEGIASYETALKLRPNDIVITSNYAGALAEIDFETYGTKACDMLIAILKITSETALEREVQSRMQEVIDTWNDDKVRHKKIEQFLDGKGDDKSNTNR